MKESGPVPRTSAPDQSIAPTMGPVVVYPTPQGGTKTFRTWHAPDGTTVFVPTDQSPPTG